MTLEQAKVIDAGIYATGVLVWIVAVISGVWFAVVGVVGVLRDRFLSYRYEKDFRAAVDPELEPWVKNLMDIELEGPSITHH